jgi:uncharacterized cupredoxin-like copper-binding protein
MILRAVVGGSLLLASLAGAGLALAADGDGAPREASDVLGPGPVTVEIGVDYSAFDVDRVRVRQGTEVTFVVVNSDPILHELIVGPDEVHRRHENGTEAEHPPRPGEVTVDPLTAASTTYAFDDVGPFEFACHLPGHLAYGMRGVVEVVPA